MNWKQYLTEEVLKECWHEFVVAFPPVEPEQIPVRGHKCKHCGKYWPTKIRDGHGSRTFDNRNDLLDLYEAINRKRDFWQFEKVCWEALKTQSPGKTMQDILNNVTPWMFCFSGEGYEERCRMAAEFYGWEESHD